MTKPKTELEKKRTATAVAKKSKVETLSDLLNSDESKRKISQGAPKYLDTQALIRVALNAVQKNKGLLNCSAGSILQACMDCGTYGLVPNSMIQEAHLIPFKDTCQLVVGYKGLLKLATNTGLIRGVRVRKVMENDDFDYREGLDEKLDHKPALGKRGDFRGAYAIILFKDGDKTFEYVSAHEGEEHRKRFSRAKKGSSPWDTNFEAMVMKTALRKALKYIPASPDTESERMSAALHHDERIEDGIIDLEPIEKDEIPDPQPKSKKEALKVSLHTEENGKSTELVDIDPDTGEVIPPESEDPTANPQKAGDALFPEDKTRPHD